MRQLSLILASLVVCAPNLLAEDTPDPRTVFIDQATYSGDGCESGHATATLSPDAKAVTMLFDSYQVNLEPSIPVEKKDRKNCKISLQMRTPPGWSFALVYMDFRGYANLTQGAVGAQNSSYSMDGKIYDMSKMKLRGPYDNEFQAAYTTAFNSQVWSGCSGSSTLNIDSQLDLKASLGGHMAIDSLDAEVSQEYGILWRRCDSGRPYYAAICKSALVRSSELSNISSILDRVVPIIGAIGSASGGSLSEQAEFLNDFARNMKGMVQEFAATAYDDSRDRAKELARQRVVQKCQNSRKALVDGGLLCRVQQSSCSVRNLADVLSASNPAGGVALDQKITCSSEGGKRKECAIGVPLAGARITLEKRLSQSACKEGSSWGTSDRGIWVDKGCRAEFRIQR